MEVTSEVTCWFLRAAFILYQNGCSLKKVFYLSIGRVSKYNG
jgi:hypothetical protein